ncbi:MULTISPECIES: hypothetical protein [Lysinibacillus]|uniref:hypothetical protein n=1 Tax=Lysinibacillus TaxID=400634 RepID=UPI002162678D|nr:hypothetical protein [Lysinibacillus boronitolerans]MCS1390627.1 hypothetical protein [Lysinibacillus boronitolerans]
MNNIYLITIQDISILELEEGEEFCDFEEANMGYFSGTEIEVQSKCRELENNMSNRHFIDENNIFPRFVYEKLNEIK